jgi:hypothetical protein
MPSLKASAVSLDPQQYRHVAPTQVPEQQLPPVLPAHLVQSTVMISSMPSIVTNVDGITRQFYGCSRTTPMRRLNAT